ncbi:MAG: sulfurtransferase TusA family protein [Gammaproteobacteria bacterium]|jgi:tRNA 2-thiouridine synthesizing protein A|uniref:sulfurtransferase TusA family protein n=1 Tax=Acinetobacter towneri TaxID=202956 RepID=UPI0016ADBA46|nr:sulfurtransferase TusA family protein [Acinetobacter towneri]MBF4521264.1 sulfurtransferase TusA family protein [Acinetobacter towneri]NLN58871.1 sulfurtransferase TusA family protein [Gammaproteobacteria bacterium]
MLCDSVPPTTVIDAMGQPCPMPLLMLKRALKNSDAVLFLLKSSDPHSQQDVTRYCQLHQYQCTASQISANEFHYVIHVAKPDAS